MKREILCEECYEKWMIRMSPTVQDEHFRFVKGKAIGNMFCDRCGKHIVMNEKVIASSIWSDRGGVPYYPWERGYLYE